MAKQHFAMHHWYVAATSAGEVGRTPFGPHDLQRAARPVPREDDNGRGPRRPLSAPALSAVEGRDRRRRHRVRLSRPAFRWSGCVHAHSRAEEIPARFGVRSYLSCERSGLVFVYMGDAARADPASFPISQNGGRLGRLRRASSHRGQLAARRRQPARPHAPDVRAQDDAGRARHPGEPARRARRGRSCNRAARDARCRPRADLPHAAALPWPDRPLPEPDVHPAEPRRIRIEAAPAGAGTIQIASITWCSTT